MNKILPFLILVTPVLFTCKPENRSSSKATQNIDSLKIIEKVNDQNSTTNSNSQFIDSRYQYADAMGNQLLIENSYPKGGLRYTDRQGKEYVYAIFWTRITNHTSNSFDLNLHFTNSQYQLPSEPNNHLRIYIPKEDMSIDKESLRNYGLDPGAILDNIQYRPSSSSLNITPNHSKSFYIITVFNHGVNGSIRSGFELEEENLQYRINDLVINCGLMKLPKLTLQD